MLYRLSLIIPVRFTARLYGVQISAQEVDEGGHGNHYRSGEHFDAETCTWWQWRNHIWRRRTLRMCLA